MVKHIKINKLLSKQFEKGRFCKYDIIIRYLFVKEYYKQGQPENFKYKMCSKLAVARDTKDRYKKFIRLIKSFEENGYDEKFPLEMSSDYYVCGGTHRIALCLYFGVENLPYIINDSCSRKRRRFNIRWLKKNGFVNDLDKIERTKKELFKKIGL